ncbi:hypothetical protein NQ315_002018 [Exocentrus adspersus]|uniref:Bee-milk protein n=1 Tax=Exocentrus adspersus TaxID=1586481 RepID=A0AAV8WAG6_9CUCU|nr:hypothetical protein NQ315_002018 [Exocentrus adspersus]
MEKTFWVCFFSFISVGRSWDLINFGINENYYISDIAIYRSKAFLTLPRSVCHNHIINPTVIEVPWSGGFMQSAATIVNTRTKILDHQKWENCNDIQDAISLVIEPTATWPKLWILDKGNEVCTPKIWSYNIIYNSLSDFGELENIPGRDLNSIVIDPIQGEFGYRMYVGNAGENTLLIFTTKNLKWWKVTLQEPSNSVPFSINADFLTISKTDSALYITGKNNLDLFSINLDEIRNFEEPLPYEAQVCNNYFSMEVNATLLGQKLGISTGLEADLKSGLNYYMVRDYVVVRWLIGLPMDAEYHNVLAQSYENMPYVVDLFTCPQYGLWALVNPLSPEDCNEINNTIAENIPKLSTRVIKILKYNKFLDNMY